MRCLHNKKQKNVTWADLLVVSLLIIRLFVFLFLYGGERERILYA